MFYFVRWTPSVLVADQFVYLLYYILQSCLFRLSEAIPPSLTTMGINHDSVRQKLESTMFVKLNSSGHPYEEHYVAHIKVWEAAQDSKGKKSRYIVLSRTSCWSS